MNDSRRNCVSVKCKCKHRQLFHKDEIDVDEHGQRYIICDKCGKKIILKRI